MAQGLQVGDRVSVIRGFRTKPDSSAYRQGLKSVGPKLVGEVAGPAPEGRALLVSFKGIEVPVKTQNLERADELLKNQRRNDQQTAQQSAQEQVTHEAMTPEPEQSAQEVAPKKTRGRRPKAEQPAVQTLLAEPQAAEDQESAQEVPAPRKRSGRPANAQQKKASNQPAEPPTTASEPGEGGLQLLTLIANKMLLTGNIKLQSEVAVEVSLSDLPAEVQRQLQRLIDAK